METQRYLTKEQFSQMMAHAWKDSAFKARLENDPTGTIRDAVIQTDHTVRPDPAPVIDIVQSLCG